MPATNSTATPRKSKRKKSPQDAKPYADFPLTAHPTGRWCKKIRGKVYFFGKLDDWQAALDKYQRERDDLYAGRKPRQPDDNRLTVGKLCNKFLNAKKAKLEADRITSRTYDDYERSCEHIGDVFGWQRAVEDLRPEDFELLRSRIEKRYGVVRRGNEIQRVRSVFRYANENGLVPRLVVFGSEFKGPSKKELRLHRAKAGKKILDPKQIKAILAKAKLNMRAMILLGLNCGFGNNDCATMPLSVVDLDAGWIDYHRPKTGVQRRCPLWPETVKALRAALAKRPTPRVDDHGGLFFLTKYRMPWFKDETTRVRKSRSERVHVDDQADQVEDGAQASKRGPINHDNPVTREMTKILKSLELHRPGLGFYTLRHIFRTVADGVRDERAVDRIMGHVREDIADTYIEAIDDSRLRAVTDHVHAWLYGKRTR